MDATLSQLCEDAGVRLRRLGGLQPTVEKREVSRTEAELSDLFSRIRAKLRDLEVLSEEQDTAEESEAVARCVQAQRTRYEALQTGLHDAKRKLSANAERVRQRIACIFYDRCRQLPR